MARGAEGARGLRSKFGRCLFGKRYGNEELLMARLVCNLAWFFLACGFAFGQASPESVDQEWRAYVHEPRRMRVSRVAPIHPAKLPKTSTGRDHPTPRNDFGSYYVAHHL